MTVTVPMLVARQHRKAENVLKESKSEVANGPRWQARIMASKSWSLNPPARQTMLVTQETNNLSLGVTIGHTVTIEFREYVLQPVVHGWGQLPAAGRQPAQGGVTTWAHLLRVQEQVCTLAGEESYVSCSGRAVACIAGFGWLGRQLWHGFSRRGW